MRLYYEKVMLRQEAGVVRNQAPKPSVFAAELRAKIEVALDHRKLPLGQIPSLTIRDLSAAGCSPEQIARIRTRLQRSGFDLASPPLSQVDPSIEPPDEGISHDRSVEGILASHPRFLTPRAPSGD